MLLEQSLPDKWLQKYHDELKLQPLLNEGLHHHCRKRHQHRPQRLTKYFGLKSNNMTYFFPVRFPTESRFLIGWRAVRFSPYGPRNRTAPLVE